jgi:hypothetical protein
VPAYPPPEALPETDPRPEPTAVIFADLNQGRKLCDIVAERGFPPSVVKAAHEQYLQLAQIDTLKTPAGERRLFALARMLEVQKEAVDTLMHHINRLQEQVDALMSALGLQIVFTEED